MIVRTTRWLGIGAAVAFTLALAACAPIAPPATSSAPPPATTGTGTPGTSPGRPSTPTETPRRETPVPAPRTASTDSGPTTDAQRVLATIPEPLGGASVPPSAPAPTPRDTARVIRAVAPEAAGDTLRASRPAEDDGGAVPVPEPTTPLRPSPVTVAPVDSSASRPPAAAPVTPPASTPPATETAPASPPPPSSGECFRLQVAAPAERVKAESRRSAAESLLLVPMVIERDKGLYKVRTRDCLSREAAASLRHRATESGFTGAFVISGKPSR